MLPCGVLQPNASRLACYFASLRMNDECNAKLLGTRVGHCGLFVFGLIV